MRILLAIVLLTMLGCHKNKLTSGVIQGLYYSPAHRETRENCGMVGKILICTPYEVNINDSWFAIVKGIYKKDTITENIYIDSNSYNKFNTGDTILISAIK